MTFYLHFPAFAHIAPLRAPDPAGSIENRSPLSAPSAQPHNPLTVLSQPPMLWTKGPRDRLALPTPQFQVA